MAFTNQTRAQIVSIIPTHQSLLPNEQWCENQWSHCVQLEVYGRVPALGQTLGRGRRKTVLRV